MDVPVKLEIFEGPLDLLLHLIRKNEVDIYDIPIALITRQYLEYLDVMREMNIGLAGEFLVMAATLTHIKSRTLLPSYDSSQDGDQEEDPRSDLVERLKEHLRMKDAAERLGERPLLDRDVFTRAGAPGEVKQALAEGPEIIVAGVFDLIEAFRRLLRSRGPQLTLSVRKVKVTLEERMGQLLDLLRGRQTITFEECFADDADRGTLVVTFLALLELTRLGLLKVYQERTAEPAGPEGTPANGPAWGTLRLYFNYKAQERWAQTAAEKEEDDQA